MDDTNFEDILCRNFCFWLKGYLENNNHKEIDVATVLDYLQETAYIRGNDDDYDEEF